MFFQPEIETMPREELRELQLERMRESLRNAYENVPLYRERFDAAGVTPDDLTSLEDIAKFPFVVKQDMRDNYPFGMFARENADVARIHASSGTTGQATVVGHTANDLANWGDCFARGIAMVGGDENSTIQVSYGYGLFTGGLGAHAGGEAMGCTVIPTSSGNTKRQVQMLKDCKTDILACTPSYALLIADTAIEMGYDPATEFQISGGIFGAEPCSENMRQEIADKLGIQYCDVYGLSEIMGPGVAMECAERGGLHIAEDQFYCEIIDPETLEVLPDGEVGELVITTLTRECSPMIRYRTRDVTTINAEPCACGRTHRKIGRLLGRTDDMLIIRGVNVFPSQIEQVITEFPEIATQYQIILTMNGPLDHVELQVETEPDFPIDEVRRLEDLRNRLAAAAWYDADYPLGAPLKAQALNRLESLTGCRPAGRVMLLTQLRYFGFHFNPVNFYYCYDEADTLRWVLAEVRNTPWNERHYYAVDGQQARPLEKAFHVSPFNPMDMVYHWRFNAPGKTLHMHIENHQASKVFDATLALSRVPLTRANLRGLLLRLPMMTLKTVLAIYWQALRLWLKRVPLYNHPVSRSERS